MATKLYPHTEDASCEVNEPVVSYQPARSNIYQVTNEERESILRAKEQFSRGEYYTETEMDRMIEEWLNLK